MESKYKSEKAVFPANDLHKKFLKACKAYKRPKSKILVTLAAMFLNGDVDEDKFLKTLETVSSKFQKPGRK